MTALYPPLPYFGSLIVTELWTAFVATAAILVCLRAAQRGRLRDYVLAGALFTATTMVRPAFVLMPFFFAIAVPLLVKSQRTQAALKGWAALVRHRRARADAVARLQLRQPRTDHPVARRRHWPRPVGRQLAGTMAWASAEGADRPRRRDPRSR